MCRTPLPLLCAGAVLLFVLPGCQQGQAPLAPVRGKITYRGMWLQNGTIVFTPDASRGTTGPLSLAVIQPDGSYTLRSDQGFGAVPGWHRVTVAAVYTPSTPVGREPFAVPLSLVPDRYRDPELSRLVCEVKADQTNVFDFNLAD
jgi:hypothetical protein